MKKIVYLVCEEIRSKRCDDENNIIFATLNREKAEEKANERARELAGGLEIDLDDIDTDQWEVVSNEYANVEIYDSNYDEGYACWVREIELED